MSEVISIFSNRKRQLKSKMERFWSHEDLLINFQTELSELKALVEQFPDSFSEQFRLELIEIEIALRESELIE